MELAAVVPAAALCERQQIADKPNQPVLPQSHRQGPEDSRCNPAPLLAASNPELSQNHTRTELRLSELLCGNAIKGVLPAAAGTV